MKSKIKLELFKFRCPHCNAQIKTGAFAPLPHLQMSIVCPKCRRSIPSPDLLPRVS